MTQPSAKENPTSGTFKEPPIEDKLQILQGINQNLIKENKELKEEVKKAQAQVIFNQNVINRMMGEAESIVAKAHMKVQKDITEMTSAVSEDFVVTMSRMLSQFDGITDEQIRPLQNQYRQIYRLPPLKPEPKEEGNAQKESPSK